MFKISMHTYKKKLKQILQFYLAKISTLIADPPSSETGCMVLTVKVKKSRSENPDGLSRRYHKQIE